jgi:hypothetical protein
MKTTQFYRNMCYFFLRALAYPEGGFGEFKPPSPKLFRSFDKPEPNSQFRGKYILRT